MEAVILDLDYFILIFCPARRAETRHVSIPIGSQLIGTAQTKCVRLRHGSHTSRGNEVIFIDPHKGIHDDENNSCL